MRTTSTSRQGRARPSRASSRSSRARPTSTRARRELSQRVRGAVEEWLSGWDADGAGGTSGSSGTRRFAPRSRACSTRRPTTSPSTSVSQGVSGLVSALPLDGKRNRIVISEYEFPDRRPDRACAEAPWRGGRPRAPRIEQEIPAERFAEAIDEPDSARLLHHALLPLGAPARRRCDRGGRARSRRDRAR